MHCYSSVRENTHWYLWLYRGIVRRVCIRGPFYQGIWAGAFARRAGRGFLFQDRILIAQCAQRSRGAQRSCVVVCLPYGALAQFCRIGSASYDGHACGALYDVETFPAGDTSDHDLFRHSRRCFERDVPASTAFGFDGHRAAIAGAVISLFVMLTALYQPSESMLKRRKCSENGVFPSNMRTMRNTSTIRRSQRIQP